MSTYSAKAIANAFYDLGVADGQFICPMKMQKLVYIAHGWSLGLLDEPLIREQIQAWKYGPVIKELYHEFKVYGNGNITKKATDIKLNKDTLEIDHNVPEIAETDDRTKQLIHSVWNAYKKFSGGQLSNITHQQGTPWDLTYNGMRGVVVDNNIINDHYKKLARERAQPQ